MEFPTELESVNGAQDLFDWFGYWPSFHDAEVVCLNLNRGAACSLVLKTWEMTKEIDVRGYYVQAKHVIVEFVMKEVVDLNLNGFNHQNVIFGLAVEKVENCYRLTLDGCYGMAGTIDATDVSILLRPVEPAQSPSFGA